MAAADPKFLIQDLDLWYGQTQALKRVAMSIEANSITALIGPSGCGKSTFLRVLDRMNDLIDGVRIEGRVLYDGADILAPATDVIQLRKRIGMVFQKPNPFPMSIYENVAYGPRVHGTRVHGTRVHGARGIEARDGGDGGRRSVREKRALDELVEKSLANAALFDEVKDRLHKPALGLSGGQQQRLCIARVLAVEPDVLLMDEPTSALDPISTAKIETLLGELKRSYTIVIVTHNMQQAGRVSDTTGFFLHGELVEFGSTKGIFFNPRDSRTENYISGRFG